MSDRSNLRLAVLAVLLFSLVVTMLGRLFFLQVVSADVYNQIGARNSLRSVITPAPRGLIVDQTGRPLVDNRTSLVVSLDRATIEAQPDKGKAVLTKLAGPLGTTYEELAQKVQLCGTPGATPGVCWNGNPLQPIPVAKDVSTDLALSIMERRADFPGVLAQLETVRQYPQLSNGVNAAQILGYLGAVSQPELDNQAQALKDGTITKEQATLTGTSQVGRAGLEASYDGLLRGTPGVKELKVDKAVNVLGVASETDPVPGDTVVTNIDAKLQAVVEQQLEAAIQRARNQTDDHGKPFKADSGAAVVLDVKTGAVLALASYPTYDPSVWVGGISAKQYTKLTDKKSGLPLLDRVTQGLFAPASTFKIATTSAALMSGKFSMDQKYECPSYKIVGGKKFNNSESKDHGMITFKEAIEVSCDTIFYRVADTFWKQQGGLSATAEDPVTTMAKAYGMGRKTGIDLPSEYAGQVGGRIFQEQLAAKYRDDWCQNSKNPKYKKKYRAIMADNCATGYPYQVGNALNTAIGQGDTAITPLQVAQAYAALANGGTIYEPHVAKAVVGPDGKIVQTVAPKKTGKLPVSRSVQDYLRAAFAATTTAGTAAPAFTGFPLGKVGGIATKTGTGQVSGKQSTSWFASYAPVNDPRYAVVMMVSQGGTGVGTSGPSVRAIYESIFGVHGSKVDAAKSVFEGGAPQKKLPSFDADGNPVYPGMNAADGTNGTDGTGGSPGAEPNMSATPADSASPDKRKNDKAASQGPGP